MLCKILAVRNTFSKPCPTIYKNSTYLAADVFGFTVIAQGSTTPVITLKLCEGKQKPEHAAVEQLPAGSHVFPFNWLIPAGMPSSFQGDGGCVKYFAQCTLFAPGCRRGCKTTVVETKHFTVLRHFDLNSNKAYKVHSVQLLINRPLYVEVFGRSKNKCEFVRLSFTLMLDCPCEDQSSHNAETL